LNQRRKAFHTLLPVAQLIFLSACGGENAGPITITGNTMGTRYSVQIVTPDGSAHDEVRDELAATIDDQLNTINARYSTYLSDSEVSRFNDDQSGDWYPVSDDFCQTIETAIEIGAETHGAFDITVGPVVELWGFGSDGPVMAPPSEDAIDDARRKTGLSRLHADCAKPAVRKSNVELRIDLAAYAKGLAVDRIAEMLEQRGLNNHLVEVGGELRAMGKNASGDAWRIGIETPIVDRSSNSDDDIRYRGYGPPVPVNLHDKSIATSGDYRNFFVHDGVHYSHLIDPRTGRPVTHNTISVTVLAATAGRADALATALLVMGREEGLAFAEKRSIAALFLTVVDNGEQTEDELLQEATQAFEVLQRSGSAEHTSHRE